jgi:hypothetical protein
MSGCAGAPAATDDADRRARAATASTHISCGRGRGFGAGARARSLRLTGVAEGDGVGPVEVPEDGRDALTAWSVATACLHIVPTGQVQSAVNRAPWKVTLVA